MDLRKQRTPPQPAPAAQAIVNTSLGFPTLPPRPININELPPEYRGQFEVLGFEGEIAIPGNFEQVMQQMREEAAPRLDLDPNHKIEVEAIRMNQLSPEQQAEVRQKIQEATEAFQRPTAMTFQPMQAQNPMVAQQLQAATQVTEQILAEQQMGPQIIRPRQAQPAPSAGQPAPASASQEPPRPTIPQPEPQPAPASASQPAPEPTPSVEEMSDAGGMGMTHCPHCNWRLAEKDPTEAEREDKLMFRHATLAVPAGRFTKDYPLYGGSYVLTFRALRDSESEECYAQIRRDLAAQKYNQTESLSYLMRYRLAVGLAQVTVNNAAMFVNSDLKAVQFDKDPNDPSVTRLKALHDFIYEEVLGSESLKRVAGQNFMRFDWLVEKMEANADNADFWRGIV